MNVRIGSAPVSWGVFFASDPKQIPWQRFLDEVVEAGYEWIELGPFGYLPTDLTTLRTALESRGIKVSGSFLQHHLEEPSVWPGLEKELLDLGELLVALGAKVLVLIDEMYNDILTGEPMRPSRLDEDGWKRLIDTTQKVANLAQDRFGLKVAFHPHTETHVEYEDQIELFLEQTDPNRVFICFDTGHHAYRGGDPISFMRRHHRRIPYLHLKNVDQKVQSQVATEKIPYATAVGMDMFCEPSQGAVDFLAFRDVLREVDFDGWVVVEQDMYPVPFDKPLPIAKRTRDYLREIGIG